MLSDMGFKGKKRYFNIRNKFFLFAGNIRTILFYITI